MSKYVVGAETPESQLAVMAEQLNFAREKRAETQRNLRHIIDIQNGRIKRMHAKIETMGESIDRLKAELAAARGEK